MRKIVRHSFALVMICVLPQADVRADEEHAFLPLVRRCADALIEHGRDRYGEIHSPLFMCNLDPETLESPKSLPQLDELVRTEGRPHRRNPGGSDLWEDQSLMRVLRVLTEATGDARYETAAREATAYFLEHCRKPDTELLTWGTHLYWDAHADRPGGDGDGTGPHETLIREPDWEFLWSVSPELVRKQIEGMWEWHVVDKESGLFNRHDDRQHGCDFAFMGSELILAFAFLHAKTGEDVWQERARLIADWHWKARNPETNLAPDAPGIPNRYDGSHCFTTLSGPHASLLMRAAVMDEDTRLQEIALGHLKAYANYGWDKENKTWQGMLELNGRAVPEASERAPRNIDSYDDFKPTGEIEVWRTIMYSYEFPLIAAQSYAYAAEVTRDPEVVEATRRWAEIIERNLPPRTGHRWNHLLEKALPELEDKGGTYAENYGRAIDFYLRAARVLNNSHYEELARELGREAVEKLYHEKSGLFVGHAAKGTYEATDGVGYLLLALLQLDLEEYRSNPNF